MIVKMIVLAVTGLFIGLTALNGYAAEGTVKATATWAAQGRFFLVKEKQALFVGALKGLMFLENKQGDLDAARIVCPGMVEINLDNGTESGEGRCVITTPSEDHVYASWTCAGEYMKGCAGTFTLLGGTGRLRRSPETVSLKSAVTWRNTLWPWRVTAWRDQPRVLRCGRR